MRDEYIEDARKRIVGWMNARHAISLSDAEIERTLPNPVLKSLARQWRRDNYQEIFNSVFGHLNN